MGQMVEVAVRGSIRAVLTKDRQVAYGVILRDGFIDDAEKQIDRLCLRFLVRHQPAVWHRAGGPTRRRPAPTDRREASHAARRGPRSTSRWRRRSIRR
jgi:hypothetical protein